MEITTNEHMWISSVVEFRRLKLRKRFLDPEKIQKSEVSSGSENEIRKG